MMDYQIIRSSRKTIGLEVRAEGLLVRVPMWATDAQIQAVLLQHQRWIQTHQAAAAEKQKTLAQLPPLSEQELRALADRALAVIPERAAYYAEKLGVSYGRITIRNQRSRWGSCSGKGNLNFNCLLMLAPPEVLDSVVVHELCHLRQMNHSERFYAEVLRVFPDYWRCHRWLKENGGALMQRMTG